MYYSSVMNKCSLFVSPVIFWFHQGYIICPIVTHLMWIYNAPCLLRVRSYLGLYNVCSVSVISIASSHSQKHIIISDIRTGIEMLPQGVLWSTMTTGQWWVNVAVISPTLNQPPHPQISQQKLITVTSDFLSPTTFFVWQKQGCWWQDLLYHNACVGLTLPVQNTFV